MEPDDEGLSPSIEGHLHSVCPQITPTPSGVWESRSQKQE